MSSFPVSLVDLYAAQEALKDAMRRDLTGAELVTYYLQVARVAAALATVRSPHTKYTVTADDKETKS